MQKNVVDQANMVEPVRWLAKELACTNTIKNFMKEEEKGLHYSGAN